MLCVEDTASDDDGGAGEGVAGEDGAKGGGGDVGDEEGDVHVVLFLGVAVRRSLPHEETQEMKEGEENEEGEGEMEEEGEEECIVKIGSEEGELGVVDRWGREGEGRTYTS